MSPSSNQLIQLRAVEWIRATVLPPVNVLFPSIQKTPASACATVKSALADFRRAYLRPLITGLDCLGAICIRLSDGRARVGGGVSLLWALHHMATYADPGMTQE